MAAPARRARVRRTQRGARQLCVHRRHPPAYRVRRRRRGLRVRGPADEALRVARIGGGQRPRGVRAARDGRTEPYRPERAASHRLCVDAHARAAAPLPGRLRPRLARSARDGVGADLAGAPAGVPGGARTRGRGRGRPGRRRGRDRTRGGLLDDDAVAAARPAAAMAHAAARRADHGDGEERAGGRLGHIHAAQRRDVCCALRRDRGRVRDPRLVGRVRVRSGRERGGRSGARAKRVVSRRVATAALLIASGLLLLVGGTLVYAQREFVDSGRFADRLASALRDEDVRAVLAQQVTAAIEQGRPDLIAARPVIQAATARVAASSQFQAAVRAAAVELHASVFEQDRETAALTVPDAGVLVVDAVRRVSPQLAERLSASIESRSVSVVTVRDEATAAATTFEDVSAAGVPILALAALAMAGALLLLGGARRRLIAAGLTVSGVGAVGLVALAIGRAALLDRVTSGGQ